MDDMEFNLISELENVIANDIEAAARLGIVTEENNNSTGDSEERLKECRAIVKDLLDKLKERQNPIIFFQNRNAQIALSQLDAAEQAIFWTEAKAACPRLNLLDAKRVVREATAQEKRKKSGIALNQGLIQRSGAYYTEKMTPEGPVTVPVSNFVVEPVLKIKTDDGKSCLKINVFINGLETPIERIISASDFLGRKELLKAINNVDAQWLGTDQHVQMLVGHLSNVETPTKHGVPYIGYYADRFVTPGAIFTENGPELDSNYVYIPQGAALEKYVHFPPCNNWPALTKKIVERIPHIQPTSVIWPVTGWFFAAPASQRIRKAFNEFPILHCWGTGGGGKTSIVMLFLAMLGINMEPLAALGKEFVLLKNLACTNALPIPLDEYRPLRDPKKAKILHEKLLLAYKASIDGRGRPDQQINEYKLMAPVVMAGESPLPEAETGLMERVIQVRFDKNFIETSPGAQEVFNELISLPLAEFAAGYVTWLMRWDTESIFQVALRQTNKILKNMRVVARIKHNLATILTGITLFVELAKEVGAQPPRLNLGPVFRQLAGEDFVVRKEARNAVDVFMLNLANMAHTGEITYGLDYILNEDDPEMPRLIFCTNAAISAHLKYCKVRGLENQVVSDKALRLMLEERISDYILIPYGHKAKIGPKSLRTTVINAKRLEEVLDIDIDAWRSSRREKSWNRDPDDDEPQNVDNLRVAEDLFNES